MADYHFSRSRKIFFDYFLRQTFDYFDVPWADVVMMSHYFHYCADVDYADIFDEMHFLSPFRKTFSPDYFHISFSDDFQTLLNISPP